MEFKEIERIKESLKHTGGIGQLIVEALPYQRKENGLIYLEHPHLKDLLIMVDKRGNVGFDSEHPGFKIIAEINNQILHSNDPISKKVVNLISQLNLQEKLNDKQELNTKEDYLKVTLKESKENLGFGIMHNALDSGNIKKYGQSSFILNEGEPFSLFFDTKSSKIHVTINKPEYEAFYERIKAEVLELERDPTVMQFLEDICNKFQKELKNENKMKP